MNEGRKSDPRSTKDLSELTGDPTYDVIDEKAYHMEGHCIDPYAYKIYDDPQRRVFVDFEVGSMSAEWFHRDVSVFECDPEHLKHVLRLLREVQ